MKMNETKCLSNAKMKVQNTIEQIWGSLCRPQKPQRPQKWVLICVIFEAHGSTFDIDFKKIFH